MSRIYRGKVILGCICILIIAAPSLTFGRNNVLTTGVALSLDLRERTDDAEISDIPVRSEEDDYRQIVITPLITLVSTTPRDNIEIRFQPDIRYDLLDYDTEWNSDASIAADRFINRKWQVGGSYRYRIRDYYDTAVGVFAAPTAQEISEAEPASRPTEGELSSDTGNRRYTRNFAELYSDYFYREGSVLGIGVNGDFLRYDSNPGIRLEDYDRYELYLRNEHVFNPVWDTLLDLRFIRGDYEPTDPVVANTVLDALAPETDIPPVEEELSNDLKEYRFLLTTTNNSIARNPLFVDFYYIGTQYDDVLR